MPYPYSFVEIEASGETDTFAVPFPYISQAHVHVLVGEDVVLDDDLTWIDPQQVQLPTTPDAGTTVKVYRTTPSDEPSVVFTSGALNSSNLNNAVTQLLYIIQEAFDAALTTANATENILDYLNQVADYFNQVQTMYNEIQAIYGEIGGGGGEGGAGNPYYEFNITHLEAAATDAVIMLDRVPQNLVLDSEMAERMGIVSNDPAAGGLVVGLVKMKGVGLANKILLGRWVLISESVSGPFIMDSGLADGVALIPAGSVLGAVVLQGNAEIARFGMHGSLKKDACETVVVIRFVPAEEGPWVVNFGGEQQTSEENGEDGAFEFSFKGCYAYVGWASVPGTWYADDVAGPTTTANQVIQRLADDGGWDDSYEPNPLLTARLKLFAGLPGGLTGSDDAVWNFGDGAYTGTFPTDASEAVEFADLSYLEFIAMFPDPIIPFTAESGGDTAGEFTFGMYIYGPGIAAEGDAISAFNKLIPGSGTSLDITGGPASGYIDKSGSSPLASGVNGWGIFFGA